MQDSASYILTNYHVVYSPDDINQTKTCFTACAYTYGSDEYPVKTTDYYDSQKRFPTYDWGKLGIELEYVVGSATLDLAILKCDTATLLNRNRHAHPVQLATNYAVGEEVFAIGNPNNEGLSMTKGVVSVKNEEILLNIGNSINSHPSIRTDASIYSGSSGGGLFNESGYLIGITNSGDSENQNVNYAIPLEIVKNFVIRFLQTPNSYTPSKLVLGIAINTVNPSFQFSNNWNIYQDCIIASIDKSSLAQRLDLQIGDIIKSITIDEIEFTINNIFDLTYALMLPWAGSYITLSILRDNLLNYSYTVKEADLVRLD